MVDIVADETIKSTDRPIIRTEYGNGAYTSAPFENDARFLLTLKEVTARDGRGLLQDAIFQKNFLEGGLYRKESKIGTQAAGWTSAKW